MYTGDDFKSHKDNMIGMALCLFNLGLYILISTLQFKVNSSYYSHTINSYLTSIYMPLADNFFNFKDIPTLRNLNLENHVTLANNRISSFEHFPFDSFIESKYMQHKNKSSSNLKYDFNSINVSSGSSEKKRSLISKHENLNVQYDNIIQFSIFVNWINSVFLPFLYQNDQRVILQQNDIIGDPQVFLGYRYVRQTNSTDEASMSIIPFMIPAKEYTIFDTIGQEVGTSPINLSSGITYNFTSPGNFSTFYGTGGYVFPYPKDKTKASQVGYFREDEILDKLWTNFYYSFL